MRKTHFDWSIHLHFWDFMAWKNTYPMKSSSFFFCMYTSFLSLHSCHSLSPWFCDCGSWVPCFAYIYNRKLFYPLSENCLWLILTERPSSFLSLRTIFAVRKITGLVNFIQATLIVLTKNFAHLEEKITANGFVWFTCKRLFKEYLSFELLSCWPNVLNCSLGPYRNLT